jgi:hypothetical protein
MRLNNCPICKKKSFTLKKINFTKPSNSLLSKNNNNLNFQLSFCLNCSLFYNSMFKVIKSLNLNTFFNYRKWQEYQLAQIQSLQTLLVNLNKNISIFEFGCGDGWYLEKLIQNQKLKIKKYVGYDINKKNLPQSESYTSDLSRFRNEIKQSSSLNIVICRHVLEHLKYTQTLFELFSHKKNVIFIIEVPNGFNSINSGSFEDLHFDHVSYMSEISLKVMFSLHKLDIFYIQQIFNRENILGIAYKGIKIPSEEIMNFSNLEFKYMQYKTNLKNLATLLKYDTSAFWGVGGRCLSMLSDISDSSKKNLNCHLVDSDTSKLNIKINGFNKKVISPSQLLTKRINKIYIGSRVAFESIKSEIETIYAVSNTPLPQIINIGQFK